MNIFIQSVTKLKITLLLSEENSTKPSICFRFGFSLYILWGKHLNFKDFLFQISNQ